MKEPRFGIADVIISSMLFVLVVMMFVLAVGCASTCPPAKTKILEVIVPVYSCPQPPQSLPLILPTSPPEPETLTEEEAKNWYAKMAVWVKVSHQMLLDRIQYLEEILEEYRVDTDDSND